VAMSISESGCAEMPSAHSLFSNHLISALVGLLGFFPNNKEKGQAIANINNCVLGLINVLIYILKKYN